MSGLVFVGLFVVSVVLTLGSFILGHDGDHDLSHGDAGAGDLPSVFSMRVISLFVLGFSGVGLLCTYAWGLSPGASSLAGLGGGLVMGGIGYGLTVVLCRQQASSLPEPNEYVGQPARVVTAIPANGTGEVSLTVKGQLRTVLAQTADGSALPEGRSVQVAGNTGGTLIVAPPAPVAPAPPAVPPPAKPA